MKKEQTPRSLLSKASKDALVGSRVYHQEEKEKYSKKQFVQIYKGYDFLENLYVVRTYIKKHYDVDSRMLEILLKLMGMKVFTRAEYSALPKQFTFNKFSSIKDSGYINLLADHKDVEQRLFCLNTKGKNIVINFYQYLSGEKKIPEDGELNPMANKNKQVPFDKKKMALIKKMNRTPIPEHKKKLF